MYKTFGEILAEPKETDADLKAIAKELDRASNNLLFNAKMQVNSLEDGAIAESKFFFWVAYAYICRLSENYRRKAYDDRNQAACCMAHRIVNHVGYTQKLEDEIPDAGILDRTQMPVQAMIIAKELSNTHRTIQQTFAQACFCYLDKYKDTKTYAPRTYITEIIESYADGWWKLPMI